VTGLKLRILAPALMLVALSGCGTVINFLSSVNFCCGGDHRNWPKVYGGLYVDAQMVSEIGTEFNGGTLFRFIFAIIDFGPSLIADTLTLPFTLTRGH
jgi:uncharacterized protein YceK